MSVTPRQVSWQVNGLDLAGLSWGRPGDKPLLALHGWLDNAASFVPLAPLLTGYHVVALDLPGHGQSAQRSPDASYQIWDDLPEIGAVLQQLGWNRFTLMGHSRGAIISTLYAAACPEQVTRLVLLDCVTPMAVAEDEFPRQLRRGLDDKQTGAASEVRIFDSEQVGIDARRKGGLGKEAATLIAKRNMRPCDGGYCWTTDARLKLASAVKLTPGHVEAVLKGLTMPTLLLTDKERTYNEPELFERVNTLIPNLETGQCDGGHHFHMEGNLQAIAQRIMGFLDERDGRSGA